MSPCFAGIAQHGRRIGDRTGASASTGQRSTAELRHEGAGRSVRVRNTAERPQRAFSVGIQTTRRERWQGWCSSIGKGWGSRNESSQKSRASVAPYYRRWSRASFIQVARSGASWLRPWISRPWISGGSALTPSIGRRTLATALSAQGAGPGTKNTEKHPRGPPERSGGLVLAADASRMALENTATGTSSESVRDLTDRRRRPVAEWQGAHQPGR